MAINVQQLREKSVRPDPAGLTKSVQTAVQGQAAAQAAVCGAMIWASFSAPGAIHRVFDLICKGHLGLEPDLTEIVTAVSYTHLRAHETVLGPRMPSSA